VLSSENYTDYKATYTPSRTIRIIFLSKNSNIIGVQGISCTFHLLLLSWTSKKTQHGQIQSNPTSNRVESPATANGNVGSSDSHSMSSEIPKVISKPQSGGYLREHIAEQLASITGIEAPEIFTKLQWTQTQDKGDLMLPVPALRIREEAQ
jgi:hypothetical protein